MRITNISDLNDAARERLAKSIAKQDANIPFLAATINHRRLAALRVQ